ncbi:T9SS type A sorting domain-containing protein [Aequorivita vladivostokensis]|uniref:Secretion system C-terminal sorting domain-containing protein n=1 Tax=Aequorivita vladivostokensis TaxID=171194 RepID=A0ABR5DHN6_9FLAO|nr:T9SS type A sorting domain-containing protein [Aequorivita vladivostokensis]KJJ38278.1 hypothetical protein MB09_09495 [Aequorivita vladivostokensis]MAO48231.1 T9SS C-terminal target domain-containing protein [Aequorivita sp.]HBL78656.1 T9SS C-terminal target domain-containing protein [Aequorivita sp.]|tara:strand:+ start:91 stop:1014 length:924 start_codon:yes stop_codon:yes gene_type:complete
MKKIYFLALAIGAFSFSSSYAQIDQTDDLESYSLGPISAQSPLWKTWSGDEGGPEDGIVTVEQASSGTQSLKIDEVGAPAGKDQLYIFDSQPDSGIYTVQFSYYVPSGNEGYFNIQGTINPGDQSPGSFLSPDLYFNPDNMTPGQGQTGDASFVWTFPHDAWFTVRMVFDMDAQTFEMWVDGTEAIPAGTFFNDLTVPYLGGIDFYAPSEFSTYYVDDIVTAFGLLGVDDISETAFSVYPNPVKDVLNISSKNAVDNVTIYDVLGKTVLTVNPGAISPKVDMSGLSSGAYLVQVTIGNATKTVKVLK